MIIYDEAKRCFTIHTDNSTYQMMADSYGNLLHLYYGKRTEGCMDYLLTYRDRGFSGNPYDAGMDRTYTLDVLPQEFPVRGTGDFRSTALMVQDASGTTACDLRYQDHTIRPGKYSLPGLPAVYANETNAQTLVIRLADQRLGLEVNLLYGVLPHCDIITRSAIIVNRGQDQLTVDQGMAACLDMVAGDLDLTVFQGRHAMERLPKRHHLVGGKVSIGSSRGYSSHQYNPFIILSDHHATETSGRCWSMQYVYSGGFHAEAEKDQYGQTRMLMGLSEFGLHYPLQPEEDLVLPEVIMSYSGSGFGQLSQNHQECIRKHIVRGPWRDQVRPVLINSWEASYFDFTGETILKLAADAKELGVEMVVMDDGWFGKRDDDNSGLGDWRPNEAKLQMSLGELIDRVNAMDMKFGIWMEPEMVNEDSDLYRAHPDWALTIPGKDPIRSRNQLVLDLSRPEVVDYLYQEICNVLDQGNIQYLKWDCNRSIHEVYSGNTADQGKVLYDYMIGLYDLLERLVHRYPALLIEGCCGGGGRFDAGMLHYTPQIWCSDNTDPIDRLQIQYGTSFGYPASCVGAHVSASPNEQTGRATPLETRAACAMAGTFGYELDPAKLSDEEQAAIRLQIDRFHQDAALVQSGKYYRLSSPFTDPFTAWAFVSQDEREVLVTAVLTEIHGNITEDYVTLRGLTPGSRYLCKETEFLFPADALMEMGLPLPLAQGEFQTFTMHLTRAE